MSCFENEGVCSPCNWFHENMTVFVAGACKKLRAWRKAQMEGGVSLFLKGKWLYLSTYERQLLVAEKSCCLLLYCALSPQQIVFLLLG